MDITSSNLTFTVEHAYTKHVRLGKHVGFLRYLHRGPYRYVAGRWDDGAQTMDIIPQRTLIHLDRETSCCELCIMCDIIVMLTVVVERLIALFFSPTHGETLTKKDIAI